MAPKPKFLSTLSGHKAVIIGGTSGIGLAVAQHLIEEGASVVVASSSQDRVDKAIAKLNDKDTQYNADSARVSGHAVVLAGAGAEASLNELFQKVGKFFDHLIYTAGILNSVPLEQESYEHIVSVGDIRFTSAILATKAAVHGGYLKDGGSIIFTSALAYRFLRKDWAVINAYCGAMVSLTRAFALEFSPRGIRVNCVSPGPVATDLWNGMSPADQEGYASSLLTGKPGTPEDLAITYVSLIKNKNVNSETILDDGGGWTGKLKPEYDRSMTAG
ncbi:hypothetical protein V8E36_006845 [Tilletia maclaganii]